MDTTNQKVTIDKTIEMTTYRITSNKCEGDGVNKCNVSGDTVEFSNGDLFLCPSCKNKRFPNVDKDKRPNMSSDTNASNSNSYTNNYGGVRPKDNNNLLNYLNDNQVIFNVVLGYTVYCMKSNTVDNIKHTIIKHFTNEEISKAKMCLWAASNLAIIGE